MWCWLDIRADMLVVVVVATAIERGGGHSVIHLANPHEPFHKLTPDSTIRELMRVMEAEE